MSGKMKKYRKYLIVTLVLSLFLIGGYIKFVIAGSIPDEYRMFEGKLESLTYRLPYSVEIAEDDVAAFSLNNKPVQEGIHNSISLNNDVQVSAVAKGNYRVNVKLFGLIQLKQVEVRVVEGTKLIPAGLPVGIYVETDGVLVLGTSAVVKEDGSSISPSEKKCQSGDYIRKINGQEVRSKTELIRAIQNCRGNEINILFTRGKNTKRVKVKPAKTRDGYKVGIWVRDDIEGIGTLTYVDGNKRFGALGHGIEDAETADQMNIKRGLLYEADIVDIVPGKKGKPGELIGQLKEAKENEVGNIMKNSEHGIFGRVKDNIYQFLNTKYYDVGFKQVVHRGNATIINGLTGKMQEYDIKIKKIDISNKNVKKGMEIEIVDKDLLELTNGIVQGMSGSPIIQDGKVVGAVTHVFVKNSKKGYGTFIENMLIEGN